MLKIITTPRFISGILTLEDLQRDYSSQLPKIGDILIAKVASVVKFKKSGTFGTFVNIAEYRSRYKSEYLSGLLHESKLNKKSPWSIWNKNDYFPKYKPENDRIIVEVISISKKGYGLKEVDPTKDITVEKLIQSKELRVKKMCCVLKNKQYEVDRYNENYFEVLEDNPITIKYCPVLNSLIFNDDLFINYYNDNYLTLDTKQSVKFRYLQLQYNKGFDNKIDSNKVWRSIEEISLINKKKEEEYNLFLEKRKKEEDTRLFFNELEARGPDKAIKMYISLKGDYTPLGLKETDRWKYTRYIDNDKIVYVKVYSLQDSNDRYIRVGDGKFYLESESVMLFENECLIHDFMWSSLVCFKYDLQSSPLIEKYKLSNKLHNQARSILNSKLEEGKYKENRGY